MQLLDNSFTRYELADTEYAQAVEFNTSQLALLQTYKGDLAHQILALSFRPEDVADSLVMHRYLSGKLDLVTELLGLAEQLKEVLRSKQQTDV